MNTQTHDTKIFSAMVEILISSGLGEEDYGLGKPNRRYDQTRYEELASVMNQRGFSNRAGRPLNRNALKQMVHRVRQKEACQRRRDSAVFSRSKSAAGMEVIRPPISGALLFLSGHF
jgi:hypothetical protein